MEAEIDYVMREEEVTTVVMKEVPEGVTLKLSILEARYITALLGNICSTEAVKAIRSSNIDSLREISAKKMNDISLNMYCRIAETKPHKLK